MTRTITAGDLNLDQLHEALWRAAKGLYPAEASVLLLQHHDVWLRNDTFRRAIALDSSSPPDEIDGRYAFIEWDKVFTSAGILRDPDLYGSGSALTVLRIAASLRGDLEVNIGEGLASLDDTNLRLVLAAITHAARGFDRPGPITWPETS